MTAKKYTDCLKYIMPVQDALAAINGKWKLLILISIFNGNKRFTDIEKSIPRITPKVLAKELKDLEENKLIQRVVYNTIPVHIEYNTTAHAASLTNAIEELKKWGELHRKVVIGR